MGLLRLSAFSSIPNLFKKIQSRREQKEKYNPTWQEWAVVNGDQVQVRVTVNNNDTSIFVVPDDRILFITNIIHSFGFGSAVTGLPTSSVANLSNTEFYSEIRLDGDGDRNSHTISTSFQKPIRVESGEDITLFSGTGISNVILSGFTIPKSLEIV